MNAGAPAFRELPRRARAYLAAILVVAIAVLAAGIALDPAHELDPALLAVVATLCAAAGLYEVLAPGHYSFQPNLAFFFWGAVLLPHWAVAPLAVACFLPGAVLHRGRWYLVAFNVADYVIAGLTAAALTQLVAGEPPNLDSAEGAAALAVAALGLVVVNHALIAVAASTSRGISLAGTLRAAVIGAPHDLGLVLTGACMALLWSVDPWLSLLAGGPMLLICGGLWVPLLRHKSQTDPKTGLSNFEHFSQQFTEALRVARKRGTDLSIVMVDLDDLRQVNNRHGHLAGDRLLKGVADVVAEMANGDGVAARFGGDELCILLPDRSPAAARELAEVVRKRVAALEFDFTDDVGATVSAGVAGYPEHGDTVNALLNAADAAVYDAKLGGRNHVRVALPPGAREALDGPSDEIDLPVVPEQNGTPPPPPQTTVALEAEAAHAEGRSQLNGIAKPEAASEPDEAPEERPRSSRMIPWYAALLCALAGGLALGTSHTEITNEPLLFALLICSVLVLDIVRIDVFDRATISPSAVPTLALAFMFGPIGPIAAELVAAALNLARRKEIIKTAFDFGSLAVAGAAAAGAFSLFGSSEGAILVGSAVAGAAYYAVNVTLLAVVMGLSEGQGPLAPFRERLAWLWPHYLAFGLVAGVFVVSEHALGLYALLVFALPIAMLWVGEKQYVDRSRASVSELRRKNDELELANARLRGLLDDNRELLGRMHRSYLSTITSLARTIEAKDPYTGGHTERVATLAWRLATELGFTEAELQAVNVGALIHDIGKIGVSDKVLLKEGALTEDEFAEIQRHPEISSYIVADLELPAIVKQMVRSHHEHYDGSGYPDGLAGEEIPLAARVLTVADALDAMTSDRPYRKALPADVAITDVRRKAGTQFCPRVVEALMACLERDPGLLSTPDLDAGPSPTGVF